MLHYFIAAVKSNAIIKHKAAKCGGQSYTTITHKIHAFHYKKWLSYLHHNLPSTIIMIFRTSCTLTCVCAPFLTISQ